ncbi:MAG: hypothetical protein ACM3IK_08880, partial [Sphingomonadaceae bacterium]
MVLDTANGGDGALHAHCRFNDLRCLSTERAKTYRPTYDGKHRWRRSCAGGQSPAGPSREVEEAISTVNLMHYDLGGIDLEHKTLQ